jgi:hypothetical protein
MPMRVEVVHDHIRDVLVSRWYRPTAPGVHKDHPLAQTVARWHETEFGRSASVGAGKRLGGASDAANLLAAGIPTITYGPGAIDV